MQVTNPGAAWMIALVGMHLSVNYLNAGSSGADLVSRQRRLRTSVWAYWRADP
jgi:hypothetical protein